MAPGGLIPQLGVASAGIPEDLDFGIEPEAYPHPTTDETKGEDLVVNCMADHSRHLVCAHCRVDLELKCRYDNGL